MFKGQLELSLENHQARFTWRRPRRSERARWWFDRMRQVVDCAADAMPVAVPEGPSDLMLPSASPDRQLCA